MSERVCICPGSFDPVTVGHLDIIRRAAALFDRVIVVVLHNPAKRGFFTVEQRIRLLRAACASLPQVTVDASDGMTVDYARAHHADAMVRGLRSVGDFESESVLAQWNRRLAPETETLFMVSAPEHTLLSSSAVRELMSFGGPWQSCLPEAAVPLAEAFLRARADGQ